MNANFEFNTYLQYKVKSLGARVQAFESGEKYKDMRSDFDSRLSEKNREIKKLKNELAQANCRIINVRNKWMQTNDDLVKEHAKELSKKEQEIKKLEKLLLETQIKLDEEREKHRGKAREMYQAMAELEDERGKNLKLIAQINRDYENSSIPSSQNLNRKIITNNREKTGKKPGGQPGHEGHPRKKHAPTNLIPIPSPEKYKDSPDFKPTGRIVSKQMVSLRIETIVNEYFTPEYRNVHTGQRVHADFPAGVVNDVNYSGNIKSLAYLLNNFCNVSLEKVSDFISELTGGELRISTGMINGLSKEFSQKTEAEQKKAFVDILLSPVVNTDFTTVRVNGRNMNLVVCATPSVVAYFFREHKGHQGIKGTPIEDGQQTLVHDHDLTYYSYGGNHQECLDHVSRYLKDSIVNEPRLKWNILMRKLIREMIHFRKHLNPDDNRNPDEIDPTRVIGLEAKYDEILNLANKEYEYEPPTKYYMDGFNLYKRLFEYRDNHLLFLHDRRVPYTNNLSERLLRIVKRKQRQVMTFRSTGSIDDLCNTLGTVYSLRAQGNNLYESVASIFDTQLNQGNSIAS
jgi:hypothetical protein